MMRTGTFGATGVADMIPIQLKGRSGGKHESELKPIDIAGALCARDYKGPNNYGFNAVLERNSGGEDI